MPYICYKSKRFGETSEALINQANRIIAEYTADGFKLTLRQLYYQFVARTFIENSVRSYKRLGEIINDARLAGLIDWDMIEDRTRNLESVSHWESPEEVLRSAAKQYRIDKWADQEYRPEIWIEKEALAGVISSICSELDVSFLACRGYLSQSEMWSTSMRMVSHYNQSNQIPIIIHLGDHDPSGIDMTRDITDRIGMFNCSNAIVNRIALNFNQINEFKPPSNPAKIEDSRFRGYVKKFGEESWELDALNPTTLVDLIRKEVLRWRNEKKWKVKVKQETIQRKKLQQIYAGG